MMNLDIWLLIAMTTVSMKEASELRGSADN